MFRLIKECYKYVAEYWPDNKEKFWLITKDIL